MFLDKIALLYLFLKTKSCRVRKVFKMQSKLFLLQKRRLKPYEKVDNPVLFSLCFEMCGLLVELRLKSMYEFVSITEGDLLLLYVESMCSHIFTEN